MHQPALRLMRLAHLCALHVKRRHRPQLPINVCVYIITAHSNTCTQVAHVNKARLAIPDSLAATETQAHQVKTAIPAHLDRMPNRTKNYYPHQSSVRVKPMLDHRDRLDRKDPTDRRATPAHLVKTAHLAHPAMQALVASPVSLAIRDQRDHREVCNVQTNNQCIMCLQNLACYVRVRRHHQANLVMPVGRETTASQAHQAHRARTATTARPDKQAILVNRDSQAGTASRANRATPATTVRAVRATDAHPRVWRPAIKVQCVHKLIVV